MSNSIKDSLSTMISSTSSAASSGDLGNACNWAEQAVQAASKTTDSELRAKVTEAVTGVLIKATVETRRAVMRGNGLFGKLDTNVQVIARSSALLVQLARDANDADAIAKALVIGGFARELTAAVAPHTTTVYQHTDGPTLDAFLTGLSEIMKASATVTEKPLSDGLTQDQRNKIAATALSNGRHALSAIFSKKFSDWDRASVLNKHAGLLVAESHPHLKADFAAAEAALAATDYKPAEAKLKALEIALGGSGE